MTHGRLLLLRHAESAWNAVGRWQGQADPPLSAHGEGQARDVARLLPALERIVASDLRRARRTAEHAGAALGVPVELDPRLRERAAGPWQGLTRPEIEAGWPGMLATGTRPPGFEPDPALVARVLPVLDEIGPGALVVCHGGIIRALALALAGAVIEVPNVTGVWLGRPASGRAASIEPWPSGAIGAASVP